MMRRWARPLQLLDDVSLPADIRVDVSENDKEYLVSAEIPGAKKDQEEKHGRSLVKETYHGSVSRGFTLASDVDEKAAAAKLEDGVLRLTLPKREGSASRVLKID
ncbi:Hsp20/alpha crystallin family protein [Variovorax sp. PBL-E5]|uniref:Hsp20/alpha crystallin family protein n=1 Tax=Variovorax sp. PBL-E5 TaxID=434014 RepID=UPI001315E66E|nr:Hsp20 family protein [Variovorax sp. PBL-E5]VTU22134.1 hypothetical protein E5CHR_01328 [Variovorax sp. PBL-E5]